MLAFVFILSFIALYMFYELNYKRGLQRKQHHQQLKENHEEILKQLLAEKEKTAKENDETNG